MDVTTDTILSLIDFAPWYALNALNRINKAAAEYARRFKTAKLAKHSRLSGLSGITNLAYMVLPNNRQHGHSIMSNPAIDYRFTVDYYAGEPISWERITSAGVLTGTCNPPRSRHVSATNLVVFTELIRGVICMAAVDGNRCIVRVDGLLSVHKIAPMSSEHNWYDANISPLLHALVGSGTDTFATAFGGCANDAMTAWFNHCHPALA